MPPRKLTRHSTPESKIAAEDLGNLEWERSKISQQDINMLKKLGISRKQDALRFPKEESYPAPPMQYRVRFVDHLIRGLSTPIHDFLRGLLFMIRVQPLQAAKPLWMYAGDKDVDRLSTDLSVKDLEKLVRKISSLNKKDNVPNSCGVTPYSAANALPQGHATASPLPPLPEGGEVEERVVVTDDNQGVSRPESEAAGKTNQEYELENPEGDQLLDALSLLEIHGKARDGLVEAKIGLSRLFPYFFKKKEEPAIFVDLAKCFTSQEEIGLQLRQEGLKVGVEGTIALIAESQQHVDWSRVGNTEEIETKKWQSLIKAAKPNSKKILATLGYKPAPAPSSSKPEVK
ncbi:hypothetical protein QYE76_023763 [Lolium multiflorum]|uniref:Uncharacterized protein n=1 Tax=Lolium multiflorum TaxID=4521 RepID=A0AAD8VUF2_LOLMU|nr:hypothetical protein QYE76_023763 [Lolium multiflorum]